MRSLYKICMAAAMLPMAIGAAASVADSFQVPASDATGLRGATMPYTRYDCNEAGDATLSGGASIKTSPDWAASNKATQASNQAYVDLPVGGSVAWTMKTQGDGVTVRYTIKDSNVGGAGKTGGYATSEGKINIYINGTLDRTIDLTSYFMYQYFSKGSGSPSQSGGDAPCFCFDEKHVRLSRVLHAGDVIKLECASGSEVGVDFIETEVVPDALDPNDDANGRRVFNVVDYGASTSSSNNVPAFNKAVAAARAAGGGIVFIPEGTWLLGEMWSVAGKNIKFMGAGIWYTNLQFTGYGQFGGGISGGNCKNGPFMSSDMDNIEWCHMYINSNLSDRHGENAVYKCFMDIWCAGSVIHDVWEEHFECGFWFGDYNSQQRRCSDGVRVVNCRIRNNYADGVNFCQGTSNAAVYNCSVRNNGDDGLACWNNTDGGVKDEYGNVFCYNTIDFVWRAGGVAIYGGKNQKVYNNYICDMFMASGVHMNTTFPGPAFQSTTAAEPILIENNYLVRCGTPWECWGRDYAAFDFEGSIRHLVFRNNYVFESPAEVIRVAGSPEGVIFDGLYVNGAGLSKQSVSYSASEHSLGVGNIQTATGVTYSDFLIKRGSVPAAAVGGDMEQYKSWPFWNMHPGGSASNWAWTDEEWDTPAYPDAQGIEPPVNIFDTLSGYDVVLTGIDWSTQDGIHNMYDGDRVTFRVRIDNNSGVDIPEDGAKFNVALTVDGATTYTFAVKDGLKAHASKVLEFTGAWEATKGMHTFTATVDPNGKFQHESNKSNNVRTKNVNVEERTGEDPEPTFDITQGTDLAVLNVWFEKADGSSMDEVNAGDVLVPHALVANAGTSAVTMKSGNGLQWQVDGYTYGTGRIVWNDETRTLASGETVELTPNGGGGTGSDGFGSDNTWTVTDGEHTLMAWADGISKNGDVNADNDELTVSYTFPKARPEYNDNPDKADDLVNGGLIDYENGGGSDDPTKPVFENYNLELTGLAWKNQDDSQLLYDGDQVRFLIKVTNTSDVEIPAGKNIMANVTVNGQTIAFPTCTTGIGAGKSIVMETTTKWKAVAGAMTAIATVDPRNILNKELNENDNERVKNFNVYEPAEEQDPVLDRVTGGYDLTTIAVGYKNQAGEINGPVASGEQVTLWARIANIGDTDVPAGTTIGVQWQVDRSITKTWWNDKYSGGLAAGAVYELESTGSTNNGDGYAIIPDGTHNILAFVDDIDRIPNEVSDGHIGTPNVGNNQLEQTFTFPNNGKTPAEAWDNPDAPDNVDGTIVDPGKPDNPSDPMDGLTGYNFELYGLRWDMVSSAANAANLRVASKYDDTELEINENDLISFSIRVDNTSEVDIPAGVPVNSRVTLDNGTVIKMPAITDGLLAHTYRILTGESHWTAAAGARTATAVVNFGNKLVNETSTDDNTRVKRFNVIGKPKGAEYNELAAAPVTGGSDLRVVDILWQRKGIDAEPGHGPMDAGDNIVWTAVVRNDGDRATTFGGEVKCGVQFQINGNTADITWCDECKRALQPGERVVLTANGGTHGNSWTATGTNFNVTAWVNDTHNVNNEVSTGSSDDANKLTYAIELPYKTPLTYHAETDLRDILEPTASTTDVNELFSTEVDDAWYTAGGIRLLGVPTAPGVYIHNGRKVVIR